MVWNKQELRAKPRRNEKSNQSKMKPFGQATMPRLICFVTVTIFHFSFLLMGLRVDDFLRVAKTTALKYLKSIYPPCGRHKSSRLLSVWPSMLRNFPSSSFCATPPPPHHPLLQMDAYESSCRVISSILRKAGCQTSLVNFAHKIYALSKARSSQEPSHSLNAKQNKPILPMTTQGKRNTHKWMQC